MRLAGLVSTSEIRVGPAESAARFLATDHTVWFQEPLESSVEEQLVGVPTDQRFAADVDGADQSTYPGVYGVFPMDLAAARIRARADHGPLRRAHLGRGAP